MKVRAQIAMVLNLGAYATEIIRAGIEAWFQDNPSQRARRHHAMVDAQALRAAWTACGRR